MLQDDNCVPGTDGNQHRFEQVGKLWETVVQEDEIYELPGIN